MALHSEEGIIRYLAIIAVVSLGTTSSLADGPAATVSYTYPPQARAIPALRAWLDREAAMFGSAVTAEAVADRREALKDGRPFLPYDSDRTWKVVTDTPRFLSLSVDRYDFTGGAHGSSSSGTIVWDRATGQPRASISFFTDRMTLRRAISRGFCAGLDAERREKRGGDGKEGFAGFDTCIDPTAQTIILGSSSRDRFDRIGVLIAPYNAGPYSEGKYEVTVPVTPAVLAAVKPGWRRYFSLGRPTGTP